MHTDMRVHWKKEAIKLHLAIDNYLDRVNNESTFHYEKTIKVEDMEEILLFPLSSYIAMFNINMNDFMSFIADYIRCRREGIPVLKLEYQVYRKYFKYLWSPMKL